MTTNRIKVGIIDLRINNIYSVYQSCKEAGFSTEVVDLNKKKLSYDIVILPGVGAFKSGINILKKNFIKDQLNEYLEKSNSLLYGICLGMQLLFDKSFEFEKTKGLGFINGEVVEFSKHESKKTHLGWNQFKIQDNRFKYIFKKFENKYFYFVHSYYALPKNKDNIFGLTRYGKLNFCSLAKKGNIFGTQFHPEKSGYWGIKFLKHLEKLKN